jgi:hypothetical protein
MPSELREKVGLALAQAAALAHRTAVILGEARRHVQRSRNVRQVAWLTRRIVQLRRAQVLADRTPTTPGA